MANALAQKNATISIRSVEMDAPKTVRWSKGTSAMVAAGWIRISVVRTVAMDLKLLERPVTTAI